MRKKIVFGRQDGGITCEDERKVVLIAEHEIMAHILHVFKYPLGAAPPSPFGDIHHQNARIEVRGIWRNADQLLVLVAEAVIKDMHQDTETEKIIFTYSDAETDAVRYTSMINYFLLEGGSNYYIYNWY